MTFRGIFDVGNTSVTSCSGQILFGDCREIQLDSIFISTVIEINIPEYDVKILSNKPSYILHLTEEGYF